MKFLISILLNGLLVFIAARFIDGVYIESYGVAVLTGVILGLINLTIKPIATILTLPITLLTFGLFLLVINGAMVLLADSILQGFVVSGLGPAIWFSILLSILNFFLGDFGKSSNRD